LLEGIAFVEVASDKEFGACDLGIMEVLAASTFGEVLEDIVQVGFLDDKS
jgi:hypothetical protein